MGWFRAVSHAEFRSRRTRVSATVTVEVVVEREPSPEVPRRRPVAERTWIPLGLTDPTVRWDVLPERIRPEGWVTEQADPAVPGSVMAAESERRVEGFYSPGG